MAAFEVGRADDDDDDAFDERADTEEDDGGSVTSAISASSARNRRSSALTYGRGSVGVDDDCDADMLPFAGDAEEGDDAETEEAAAVDSVDAVALCSFSPSSSARSKCSLAHASPASVAYASTYCNQQQTNRQIDANIR